MAERLSGRSSSISPGTKLSVISEKRIITSWTVPEGLTVENRISRDEMLMEIALVVKQRSTCLRKRVGAVLALDGRVLSTGYGGAPSGIPHCTPITCIPDFPCQRTIHAEANCIAFAARHGIPTIGSTLYTTLSPCRDCAKLLINAGVVEVVFNEPYRDSSPLALLHQVGIEVRKYDGAEP